MTIIAQTNFFEADNHFIYFGNLFPHEPQYKSGLFYGLALKPAFDRDLAHNATHNMPFHDGSVRGFQSQDVFEHIQFDAISKIFDDIYRCLKIGGLFRLSVPDYHSPLLKNRSAYDSEGRILCDLAMGGRVSSDTLGPIRVSWAGREGDDHVWFPTYAKVAQLILSSNLRKCETIKLQHGWLDAHNYICEPFDQSIMPVVRTPPGDMRANGKPISLVVDFIK